MSEEPFQLPEGHPGCDKACARPDDGPRASDVPATRERATTSVRTALARAAEETPVTGTRRDSADLRSGNAGGSSGTARGEDVELAVSELWGVYLHVPFCSSRCGYCDFNTYVLSSMGSTAVDDYLAAAHRELDLAAAHLSHGMQRRGPDVPRGEMPSEETGKHGYGADVPPVSTVFFGGGTPTMLRPSQLGELVGHVRDLWGLCPDAEVTTEANPETLDAQVLNGLLEGGVNRLSMGMQSADERVLALLDRHHTPQRAVHMARLAREVGFDDISLDLIFGTPGESVDSWRASLESALEADVDHLSAYSLIVEEGTRFAARVRRGELPMTDEDDLADKYLITEQVLTEAGFVNYEISNWARPRDGRDHRSRHNMGYWLGHDWWGVGPGAHSHVNGVRWWNVKHPRRYHEEFMAGRLPIEGSERLTDEQRHEETVLLQLRLADGLELSRLTPAERRFAGQVVERGQGEIIGERLQLTLDGRLVADRIITDLLLAGD